MPYNRIEIVETDTAANDGNISVEWKDMVPSEASPGYAHMPQNADQSSSRNKNTEYMAPHLLHFSKECFIILNMSELLRVFIVTFQISTRRRRNNKMNRFVIQEG